MKVALIATDLRAEDSYRFPSEQLLKVSGGNTGNFAYVQALWNHLSPHVEIFPWHASPEKIRETCDVAVIACANQLGPHTDLEHPAQTLEKIRLPVLAVGLGAQAPTTNAKVELSAGTKRWLDVVAAYAPAKTPNIGVRGEFSRQQVERHGVASSAVVVGCPSNFINPDPCLGAALGQKFRNLRLDRIAVPAGLHLWPHLKAVEQSLAELVEVTSGLYVAQSEIDMIRLSRGEWSKMGAKTATALREYIRPRLSDEEFRKWCKRYATCFPDANSWMESMRNFDFVVGARFHGVMLAIQAGTPGGVIAHDSRTLEMCETMQIPVRRFEDLPESLDLGAISSLFTFDVAAYDRARSTLGRHYVEMLTAAGIEPSQGLRGLLREIAAPRATSEQAQAAMAAIA
jgi:hypothetical protein